MNMHTTKNKKEVKNMLYAGNFIVIIFSTCLMAAFYYRIKLLPEGTADMSAKASIVRRGAAVFMKTEYKVIIPVVLTLALLFGALVQGMNFFTLLLGATMSSLACIVSMVTATYANIRTTNAARTLDSSRAINVAKIGGGVAGLSVQAFGFLGVTIILVCFGGHIDPNATGHGWLLRIPTHPLLASLTSYSLGCSTVAMFNRAAGGIYTKAADIAADIVGKVNFGKDRIAERFKDLPESQWTDQLRRVVKHGIPEDSFLNPASLADFTGDMVNDIAGNCSDLLESYVATIVAVLLTAFYSCRLSGSYELLDPIVRYVMIFSAVGLFCSSISLLFASSHKGSDPGKELDLVINLSSVITAVASLPISWIVFGDMPMGEAFRWGAYSPVAIAVVGIAASVAISYVTEYYTAGRFKPVRRAAEASKFGASFVQSTCDAIGYESPFAPVIVIGASVCFSYYLCGFLGIAIMGCSFLVNVGCTVGIDAFGPIADNAGGFAEACDLGDIPMEKLDYVRQRYLENEDEYESVEECYKELVREITDALDAQGNTTAAKGKGAAIASAAATTIPLLITFVMSYISSGEPTLNILDPFVFVSAMIGGALIYLFSAILTKDTISAATKMAEVCDKMMMNGVLAGTKEPDYDTCINLAAREGIKHMVAPSVIALTAPVLVGVLFGLPAIGGLLVGAIIVAVIGALFNGNSGGAADNAKKLVEAGEIAGASKGSAAHAATVEADTNGDIRKDVVGVALDIFIKMMTTMANQIVPMLQAMN